MSSWTTWWRWPIPKNGSLYLGIEDNGTVTGVSREHRSVDGLAVFIFFSKTVPQVAWCVLNHPCGQRVAGGVYRGRPQLADCVQYPGAGQRRLKADGRRGGAAVPEPVRQSPIPVAQLRLQRPARAESRLDDWDPVARERLRDRIRLTNSGDTLLLLDDDDLDHALLMVVDGPYGPQPSLAGVLAIGRWMRSDVSCPWHRKCFK